MAKSNLIATIVLLVIWPTSASFADWGWHPVANKMSDERWAPACCLLSDGKSCLIAGGYSYGYGWCIASADIFDETTLRFSKLKSTLTTRRDFATATLLPDGTVLICGGFNDVLGSLNSADIYDPATKSFTLLDQKMLSPRELHTANLLANGTVLIVGGLNLTIRHTQKTAEIYDPSTKKFSPTRGTMQSDRFGHASCILSDGRVLIVGGTSVLFGKVGYAHVLASAEIYNPVTGNFSPTRSDMTVGRDRPTATLLANGTVLIDGGQGQSGSSINYSEIFDPTTETFKKISATQVTVRMAHQAGMLPDGRVLIAGGWCAPTHSTTSSVEAFDPGSQTFSAAPSLPFSSHDAGMAVFPDGLVLVAGGKTVTPANASSSVDTGAWARP